MRNEIKLHTFFPCVSMEMTSKVALGTEIIAGVTLPRPNRTYRQVTNLHHPTDEE